MIDTLRTFLQNDLSLSPEVQARLLNTLLILVVLAVLRLLIVRFIHRRFREDTRVLYTWRKVVEYVVVIVGFILIGRIWLQGVQSVVTYLGLLSAGLAIALQDLLINLAGWLFIIWRGPFSVGDRVEIDGQAGDVIDIRIFEFTMLEISNRIAAEQSTGRVIHVPNSTLFRASLANFSQGFPFIWNEIPVLITFESDWEAAKAILMEIVHRQAPPTAEEMERLAQRAGRRFLIAYKNLDPTVYTQVASSGVRLTLRYLVDPRQRRNSEHRIWEQVLSAFDREPQISFAYDTLRVYQEPSADGRRGAGARRSEREEAGRRESGET